MDRPPRSSCRPRTTPSSVTTPTTVSSRIASPRACTWWRISAPRSAAERREGHREGPGVEPVPGVHEPRAGHVAGHAGLVVADVARRPRCRRRRSRDARPGRRPLGPRAHRGRSSRRAPCPPARRRGARRAAPPRPHPGTISRLARAIGTFTSSSGRTHNPWLRPDACAARWSRSSRVTDAPREVSSNAHAAPITPPPTMTTSGMSRSLPVARASAPVESTTETCLSGRKEPPAKRLTL